MRLWLPALLLTFTGCARCGPDGRDGGDAAVDDAGIIDGGGDAGAVDSGVADAGVDGGFDAGVDAGRPPIPCPREVVTDAGVMCVTTLDFAPDRIQGFGPGAGRRVVLTQAVLDGGAVVAYESFVVRILDDAGLELIPSTVMEDHQDIGEDGTLCGVITGPGGGGRAALLLPDGGLIYEGTGEGGVCSAVEGSWWVGKYRRGSFVRRADEPAWYVPGSDGGRLEGAYAAGVTDDGTLVLSESVPPDFESKAVIYPRDGGRVVLPDFGLALGSSPFVVSKRGVIGGNAHHPVRGHSAVLWVDGAIRLLPFPEGAYRAVVVAVADDGTSCGFYQPTSTSSAAIYWFPNGRYVIGPELGIFETMSSSCEAVLDDGWFTFSYHHAGENRGAAMLVRIIPK